jgi:hypothetical protein
MNNLYDIGYSEIKDIYMFAKAVNALDAVVLDIRFSPRSRDFRWNGSNVRKVLGEPHYSQLHDLGNRNYKGGPIEFVDLEHGLEVIRNLLELKNVIVMCMCPDRNRCHRLVAIQSFEERFGVASTPLHLDDVKRLAGIKVKEPDPKLQLSLF